MHPYKKVFSVKEHYISRAKDRGNLFVVPPIKNTQLKCALTGGHTGIKHGCSPPASISVEKDKQLELVAVVMVTKCPCCKKVINKETLFLTPTENDAYYHSFVENSIPGVIKYLPCNKCSNVKLAVIN
jgi:hypothetical protein